MQTEFRSADMIELHDAGVVVHVEDYPSDGLGWRDSPTVVGKRIAVDGNEAARFLKALGITFDADELFGDDFDVIFRRPVHAGALKSDVPLKDVLRIRELRARPEGPNMLHIHITSYGREGGSEEEYVQELSYSGSYTVWWSVAEE